MTEPDSDYINILEFNNLNENEGIEKSRLSKGRHVKISDIEFSGEVIEGMGKSFVRVFLHNTEKERDAGTYVAKEFNTKEQALAEIKKCLYLEKAAVPVPNTHRYVEREGKHYVIYTDLSEGGKNQVWSGNSLFEGGMVHNFTPEQREQIEDQAKDIAVLAAMSGMTIRADAYFAIIKPDRSINVVIGDLGVSVAAEPYHSDDFDNQEYNIVEADCLMKWVDGEKAILPDHRNF